MKRGRLLLVAVLTIAATAFALNRFQTVVDFLGGIRVGGASTIGTAANKVTRMLGGSETVDFGSVTITCQDSTGHTVTGALVGDPCFVGAPASPQANSNFTCYVSAADTVKVRHCAHGTAADPASATYYTRVVSNQ